MQQKLENIFMIYMTGRNQLLLKRINNSFNRAT